MVTAISTYVAPQRSSTWRKLQMDSGMDECVDNTPRDEESMSIFQFYCPLCMCYFVNTTQQQCCKNYTCYGCAVNYLKCKGINSQDDNLLPLDVPRWLSCCHCTQTGQKMFCPVDPSDEVRNYKDEQQTIEALANPNSNSRSNPNSPDKRPYSPLKVGDSFDELRRKMVTFADCAGEGTHDCEEDTLSTASSHHSSHDDEHEHEHGVIDDKDTWISEDFDDEPALMDATSKLYEREGIYEVMIECDEKSPGPSSVHSGALRDLSSSFVNMVIARSLSQKEVSVTPTEVS
ncbi:hypothetical protein TrLO_g937 [Triparma laevis f. longispina]|uniref:Uncharacterized protein n=1 Tax=Triparma laevis f. longispina TaxID=1714387 RepID=A0A9W7FJT3_9STRA|nr:hypothetical protein TrLO_g937 [Triparma laevis f. longispina]